MPRFNGTGPAGLGAGTGWGRGPCGAGTGWGREFGGRRFYTRKEESEALTDEVGILENELKAIKERLAELENQK